MCGVILTVWSHIIFLKVLLERIYAYVLQNKTSDTAKILGSSFLRKLYVVYAKWGNFSLCVVNVTWADLDSLAFTLHFFNHVWNASRLVCIFCEAMPESLSMTNTAVSSANFAVVDSVELGRSAVYSRYY
jgi:hypothetical protein